MRHSFTFQIACGNSGAPISGPLAWPRMIVALLAALVLAISPALAAGDDTARPFIPEAVGTHTGAGCHQTRLPEPSRHAPSAAHCLMSCLATAGVALPATINLADVAWSPMRAVEAGCQESWVAREPSLDPPPPRS